MTGVESQLLAHVAVSMNVGLSAAQLRQLADTLAAAGQGDAAARTRAAVEILLPRPRQVTRRRIPMMGNLAIPMSARDIFQRELAGEVISLRDPEYPKIAALITEAQRLVAEMNTGYRDPAEVRALFSRLTGTTVDKSFWLLPPFYTDFGKNIRVGRNVFVNHACEFMDRGGITLGDDVLIGPKVNLVTINHPLDPGHAPLHVLRAHRHPQGRVARRGRVGDARRDHRRERGRRRQRGGDERRARKRRRRRHSRALHQAHRSGRVRARRALLTWNSCARAFRDTAPVACEREQPSWD